MNRRRIYLMRHAQVAYFVDGRPLHPDDVPLTEEGVVQARAAAEAFRGVAFERVVTSGLRRTEQTARIIAPDVEPEPWSDFRELQAGRLEDLPPDGLEHAFIGFFKDVVPEETRFLGGESIRELLDRVVPALERLVADPDWDTVLAVLHGGVNRAILSHALTRGRLYLGNFEQAPGCINVLDVSRQDWVVRAVNVAPYDLIHFGGRTTSMEEIWREFQSMSSTTPSST